MRFAVACLGVALLARGAAGQEAPGAVSPEVLLLARIRVVMEQNLSRLPNYTCLQTIERSRRRGPTRRFELSDTLRLEVALVNGKELFAWPGAKEFEERDLWEMVGGMIGNGDFALHAKSIFLSRAASFTFAGEETREGRRTVRFHFRVPQNLSGYEMKVDPHKGIVGYHGTFWADAETLDLVRMEIVIDQIPPQLPISSATDTLEYRRIPIGERDFLLPSRGELIIVDLDGNESRNRTHFSSCRQYAGESTLSFADAPADEARTSTPQKIEVRLPAGLSFELALEAGIDSTTASGGDPISAVLVQPIRQDKQVLVPKGAVFYGRLTRVERRGGVRSGFSFEMHFDLAEFGDSRVVFAANLDDVQNVPMIRGSTLAPAVQLEPVRRAGYGGFFIRAQRVQLPRGYRTYWRTIDITEQEKQ